MLAAVPFAGVRNVGNLDRGQSTNHLFFVVSVDQTDL